MPEPKLTSSMLGAILQTAIAPAIWGSTFIVTSELLPPDRPFTAALLRVLPAGLLLVLFNGQMPKASEWKRVLILSALNIGVFQALLFVAAYRLPGGLAAVVGAIQPLLILSLAWGVDHRRPRLRVICMALMGIAGMCMLLLSKQSVWEPIGIIAAFVGAMGMALGTWLGRRWKLSLPVLALTGWQLLLGGIMILPLALLVDPPLPRLTLAHLSGYAYLCIAGALISYALWFRGVSLLSPVAVSSLTLLSPLVAVILGWVFLGQSITGTALLGLLMVLGSVLAVQWSMARPAKLPLF